jgi:hypothetical protein
MSLCCQRLKTIESNISKEMDRSSGTDRIRLICFICNDDYIYLYFCTYIKKNIVEILIYSL